MEALTLYELNNLVRGTLEKTLRDEYWLQAELSEVRTAYNGHCYVEFVQKDRRGQTLVAKARGTIWAPVFRLLSPYFERETGQCLTTGLKVLVRVAVTFHELYGYSLTVTDIDPTYTLGDLARRRREILQQLSDEGVLNDNKDLRLPASVNRIAVISSATAAGYGDFCNQLLNNEFGFRFHIGLFEAVMQGKRIEESILAAFDRILSTRDDWDVVVLIRGGGATSDLSGFDTYALAAACAQFPLPVITGIGHERDDTVLDSVAHTRVKTPTAAAAFLISHQQQAAARITAIQNRLEEITRRRLQREKERMGRITAQLPVACSHVREWNEKRLALQLRRLVSAQTASLLNARHRMSFCEKELRHRFPARLQQETLRLDFISRRCQTLDPAQMLKRGYSLTLKDGRIIRSTTELKHGDTLTTRLADGDIQSVVKP